MATIKKGTYRFNDVLTAPEFTGYDFAADINFTLSTTLANGATYTVSCIYIGWVNGTVSGVSTKMFVYTASSATPDMSSLGITLPTLFNVYLPATGWSNLNYGDGIQTITVPYDQDASDEFEVWFTANTKLVGGDAVTIEYNGNVIASFQCGTKAIRCNGSVMHTDVVVNVPEGIGGTGGVDVAADTVTEADVLSGVTFHKADGTQAEGTIERYEPERYPEPQALPKAYFPKPTATQLETFVDGKIAYVPSDAENLFAICDCQYIHQEVSADASFTAIYLRGKTTSIFGDTRFTAYYVWEEDLAVAKMVLASMGVNANAVTSQGWYALSDSGAAIPFVLNEEVEALDEMFKFFHPYNDYFYSMFDWYAYDRSKAVMVEGVKNGGGYWNAGDSLLTANRYCSESIIVGLPQRRGLTYINEDFVLLDIDSGFETYRFVGLTYIDLEIVGDSGHVQVERYAYTTEGDELSINTGSYISGKRTLTFSSQTFGIKLKSLSNMKVYTNATILTQTANEVYITGLKEDTYVSVFMGDSGADVPEWDGSIEVV